jgi:hypothetical protein
VGGTRKAESGPRAAHASRPRRPLSAGRSRYRHRSRARWPTCAWPLLAALVCMVAPGRGVAAEGRSPLSSPDELSAALDVVGDADLVVLDDPGRRPAHLRLATRVAAPVGHVRAMLVDLAAYRSALPALRRLEFEGTDKRHAGAGRPAEGMVAWELEVPLWNLEGKFWLQPTATGADLIVMEGDFSPGLVRLSATAELSGTTLLSIDASANLRDVNWITRRMVKRNALAEPGLAAAAFYVMLRALRLQAERVGDAQDVRRRPATAPSPPELPELGWRPPRSPGRHRTASACAPGRGSQPRQRPLGPGPGSCVVTTCPWRCCGPGRPTPDLASPARLAQGQPGQAHPRLQRGNLLEGRYQLPVPRSRCDLEDRNAALARAFRGR